MARWKTLLCCGAFTLGTLLGMASGTGQAAEADGPRDVQAVGQAASAAQEIESTRFDAEAGKNERRQSMTTKNRITAQEALQRLKEGNQQFLAAKTGGGDVSPAIREKTARDGQFPYAIVVTCSDSRVIPESIFSAGIGDIFVIRVAGFVIDQHQLGSIEYAADHLGTPLVVVLGHTQCGAVGAALEAAHHAPTGYVKSIIDEIQKAIGSETDGDKAVLLNVEHSCQAVKDALGKTMPRLTIAGAVYHIDSGKVDFLD